MRLSKFERRKRDILKKHEEELKALEEAERKERAKMIEPVIDKVTKVANEEVRKILERQPEIMETYTFKKREAGKAIADALQALFEEGEEDGPAPEKKPEVVPHPQTDRPTAMADQDRREDTNRNEV